MKNTQEFFQLGVTKPSKSDIQNYLNGLGTRLMQLPDIKNKIIKHFKNIKNLKLDSFGKKVLSFEEVEFEEGVDWKKYDTPFGGRHGKKFDTWDEWEKIKKEREKLEKKEMKDNIKEDMEYTTEDMEEINSLIEEIDTLCKDDSISPLREDQMCEFLLLKGAVREGKTEELRIQAEASKIPSKGLSPAQRRKMAIRMRIQAKKPGFIKKR